MKYIVGIKVNGYFLTEVKAKNLEEAKEKAEYEFQEADFGELEDIEGKPYYADDENDNRNYYY